MSSSQKIQELEADIANRDQVLKTTYEIVDQLKADQVFEFNKNEQLMSQMQETVNAKEQDLQQWKEKYLVEVKNANDLKTKVDEEVALRNRLEAELKASQTASHDLGERLREAEKKIPLLEQAIAQEDLVHWRLVEKLQAKHDQELDESNRRERDAISYAQSELKMTSEYFEEAKRLEEDRHHLIVDELTYDIGRLRTATINYISENSPKEGTSPSDNVAYASALIEIDKLKKELRSCRSVVDGFKRSALELEQKCVVNEKEMLEYKATVQSEMAELQRELTVLRATSNSNELDLKQETLKVDLMSSQHLLNECRRQLEHAESLVLSHQREKMDLTREKEVAVEAAQNATKKQMEAVKLQHEAQKSADNWRRECEDARRLCVNNLSESEGGVADSLTILETDKHRRDLQTAVDEIKELKLANQRLLSGLYSSESKELVTALGISKSSKYRGSLALGDGEGLVDSDSDSVAELKWEVKRVHRCLDGASFATKQMEQKHSKEVKEMREKMNEMEKDFGDRRRALQDELAVYKGEEQKRTVLSPELSNQGKTFQEMTVSHLETLLQEEKQLNSVLEFRVLDAERKTSIYEAESAKLKHDMEHSSHAKNNLEFKMHSLYSEIALHRSLRGIRSPGMSDQLIALSKTAQEFVSESVKETAYLCWAMVRVFDGDGKDLAEYQAVDEEGVSKPYRLPQSSWSINRTIFSDPNDLMSSFDRISPQMITPFKSHGSFAQLKALVKKRTAEEVASVSMSCGYIWGWASNTLVCADISVNIDV